MTETLHFDARSTAQEQLLALAMIICRRLNSDKALLVKIPEEVHRCLTPDNYGSLLYDLLVSLDEDVGSKMHLRVHKQPYFELTSTGGGAANVFL
jgi:hypothetical protein